MISGCFWTLSRVGNWYNNITTVGPGQADIAAWCARHDRHAYVTPTRAGITVVFDRDVDQAADPGELGDLALVASLELGCPVFAAAVYDDDVLLLALYDSGKQIGEYSSANRSTLGAATLCRLFGVRMRAPIVWLVLNSPRLPFFLFESFRHQLLLRILRQPLWALASGYRYIRKGDPPPHLEETDLVHIEGGRSR
jgi:hypothetical protein